MKRFSSFIAQQRSKSTTLDYPESLTELHACLGDKASRLVDGSFEVTMRIMGMKKDRQVFFVESEHLYHVGYKKATFNHQTRTFKKAFDALQYIVAFT